MLKYLTIYFNKFLYFFQKTWCIEEWQDKCGDAAFRGMLFYIPQKDLLHARSKSLHRHGWHKNRSLLGLWDLNNWEDFGNMFWGDKQCLEIKRDLIVYSRLAFCFRFWFLS